MPIRDLAEYVRKYSVRQYCPCGNCPQDPYVTHTADMVFFPVSLSEDSLPQKLNADSLSQLVKENVKGDYCNIDLFDNKEHSFIEIGGWIGDQGLALQLMGMGWLLGLWQCMTPRMVPDLSDELVHEMAGSGLVCIVPHNELSPIRYRM